MRKKAFTLIELLVVMAVLSLLMAILMPVLARARQQGRSIVCLSNLRQMAMTTIMYTESNNDSFPMAYVNEFTGSVLSKLCAWDFTTVFDPNGETTVEPGLLWQGQMTEKIQQCPSFKGEANWGQDRYTGYNYNRSYIGGRADVGDGVVWLPTLIKSSRTGEIRKPDSCALFGDGQWKDGANKFMLSPFEGKLDKGFFGRYAGTQGFRHLGKTNVAYCDGSVRSVSDCFTETDPAEQEHIAEGTGFLSPDNSAYDLQW